MNQGSARRLLGVGLLLLAAQIGYCDTAVAAPLPRQRLNTGIIVLKVGPRAPYKKIAAAVAVANADRNLDKTYVVEIAPGTYTNDFLNVTRPMTIEASGSGPVVLNATENAPNDRGIIYATANLTVRGLTFRGARVADNRGGNGAGIRDQNIAPNGRLTVEDSIFERNQTGILTDPRAHTMTITITNDKFRNNGRRDGVRHALYVNAGSLIVTNSLFCGQLTGHLIKSRAHTNVIANSRFYDGAAAPALGCEAGSSSIAVEFPNGGDATVTGSTIIQGPASPNFTLLSIGVEGLVYPHNSLKITDTRFSSPGTSNSTAIFDPHCIMPRRATRNNTFDHIRTIINPAHCP